MLAIAKSATGSNESTIFLSRKDFPTRRRGAHPRAAGPTWRQALAPCGSPIPITMPTYVSKPLAPRTVRTIDLSGPGRPRRHATKGRSPQTRQPRQPSHRRPTEAAKRAKSASA